nr:laccase-2-like [Procambarus clarkii]XP_045624167.1 laccase-2-like [Procambarus clarkii]
MAVCQLSAVAAATMVALVLAAAIATLTSVITAHEPVTPGKNCYRKCVEGDTRTCHFHFDVHAYQTMSRACYGCPKNATDCGRPECIPGDGVKRRIVVINKQMPGPPIQVCLGDRIVVDVKNSLHDESITMHWHGITMQGPINSYGVRTPGTPHMDGVPGVTQCPIHSGTSFRYTFYASEPGTHFYHSHTGFQRADGAFGALIVRQPPALDQNHNTFDYDLPEHVILFHDWLHIPTQDKFVLRHHGGDDDFPNSMLVNGQGPHQHMNATLLSTLIPYKRFKVTPGNRYRMRLINTAVLNCPIVVAIDQHVLTVIASDGYPIVPLNATSLVVYPGERWDVVVDAGVGRSGTFWMSFMGGVDCAETEAHQFALLEYETPSSVVYESQSPVVKGKFNTRQEYIDDLALLRDMPPKPKFTEVPPKGVQVNSINSACYEDLVCVAHLRSPNPLPQEVNVPRANFTIYLAFEMRRIHNAHFYSKIYYNFDLVEDSQQIPTPQINNISFVHPASPLILTGENEGEQVCNADFQPPAKNCNDDYCECLHMYTIPLGSIVDLVMIDEGQYGDENHPIHLHGQSFWVLGQDRPIDVDDANITRSQVMEMDQKGQLVRNFDHPVYKDTVTMADGGYTIVRFHATNPGYWLLHCHLIFHSVAGMNLVFKVGEDHEIPQAPPDFPSCGNFKGSEL